MRKQKIFQNKQKETRQNLRKIPSEAEINNLSDKELKVMVINIFSKPKRIDGYSENSKKT